MSRGITPKKKALTILFFLLLGMASFGFLAIFSYSTSPFTTCDDGADSAFFRLVGQGMTKGYLPYRDFFDMKGPLLFFIEYVGQVISYGRVGIFIVQWVNLWAALVIICRIFELYHISNRMLQIGLLLPLAYVASFTFEGGNLTEEFSLVPLLSCLYLCLTFFHHSEKPTVFWQQRIYGYAGAWYGICFGLLLMIRVTNAASLCAMVLTILFYLVVRRKFRQLAVCVGMFFVGLTVSVMPAILFFGAKGLLHDMLEAVFVLGFKYSGEKSFIQHAQEVINGWMKWQILLVIIPAVIPLLTRWRGWKERSLAFIGGMFTFFAIASGNNYPHYYTLAIPLIVLGEIAVVEAMHMIYSPKAMLAMALSAALMISQFSLMKDYLSITYSHFFRQDRYPMKPIAQDISSKIPEQDRGSVFCYNINPSWYTYADMFPCIKYCGWQNHYISLMPEIYGRLKERFHSQPPVWLVLPRKHGVLPDFLETMLQQTYKRYDENEEYTLYSLPQSRSSSAR